MKKLITTISLILVLAVSLCACAPAITFQTSGAQYEVAQIATAEQALDHTASRGNTLLSITLKTNDNSLDDAQNAFMPVGGEPCYVTDGATQYPCIALSFQSNGTAVQAVLLFEVPGDWERTKEFSLGGSSFSAVALKK